MEKGYQQTDNTTEGTTPRRLADVIASLADLVSGSADASTPLISQGLSPEKDRLMLLDLVSIADWHKVVPVPLQ